MLEKILEVLEHLHLTHTYRTETVRNRVSKLLDELRQDADLAGKDIQDVIAPASPPAPAPVVTEAAPGAEDAGQPSGS